MEGEAISVEDELCDIQTVKEVVSMECDDLPTWWMMVWKDVAIRAAEEVSTPSSPPAVSTPLPPPAYQASNQGSSEQGGSPR